MSRSKQWKSRLQDIKDATSRIQSYCKDIKTAEEFSLDTKTVDACIRNLQILGEASNKIPPEIKKEISTIPWKEIKGMRNILVHRYFGTSDAIIWNTIKNDLPNLEKEIDKAIVKYNSTSHQWKICAVGEYFVRGSHVDSYVTGSGKSVKEHLRSQHCREYSEHRNINILSMSEIKTINDFFIRKEFAQTKLKDIGFGKKGAEYDSRISGWVKYWNEIFKPTIPLDPNFMKALIASESSFDANANRSYKGKKPTGRGIGQLTPLTVKSLMGYRNELKDHFINIEGNDLYDPDINLSASIRWMFQKRKLASSRLKREPSWLEAVETYKNVLGKKKDSKVYQRDMGPFLKILDKMEKEK